MELRSFPSRVVTALAEGFIPIVEVHAAHKMKFASSDEAIDFDEQDLAIEAKRIIDEDPNSAAQIQMLMTIRKAGQISLTAASDIIQRRKNQN